MPVAFGFMAVNLIAVFFFWGGITGLEQLIRAIMMSVSKFFYLPVALFVLMGEVMFHSGIAPLMIDALDKWVGRLPGRLGLLAVGAGTLFSTLSGNSMASTAMMGSVLVPEMEKRGYKKSMSIGPILGSGGLAIMIPPSSLAVLLGALAYISIGKLLIAITVPGLMMAVLYATYIIVRCWLQPSIAPTYKVTGITLSEKVIASVRHILPLGFIIFAVLGTIFLGIATPSEAAATGTVATFILAAAHRRLNWEMVKKSLLATLRITGMLLLIITGAFFFSKTLAFSGASVGLLELVVGLPFAPIIIIIAIQVLLLVLGMFVGSVTVMMITLPILMPIIHALGFDPVWFGAIFLLNMEMGQTTPPFGFSLFVMKGVAPPDTTTGDIWRAGLPFVYLDAIVIALMLAFPSIVLWLPGLMR